MRCAVQADATSKRIVRASRANQFMRRLTRRMGAMVHEETLQVGMQNVTKKLAHVLWLWRVSDARLTTRVAELQTMYNNTEVEAARLRTVLHDVSVRALPRRGCTTLRCSRC